MGTKMLVLSSLTFVTARVLDSSRLEKAVLGKCTSHLQLIQSIRNCVVRMPPLSGTCQHLQESEQDVPLVGYMHGLRFPLQSCGCWPVLDGLSYACVLFSCCWDLKKQQWMLLSKKERRGWNLVIWLTASDSFSWLEDVVKSLFIATEN